MVRRCRPMIKRRALNLMPWYVRREGESSRSAAVATTNRTGAGAESGRSGRGTNSLLWWWWWWCDDNRIRFWCTNRRRRSASSNCCCSVRAEIRYDAMRCDVMRCGVGLTGSDAWMLWVGCDQVRVSRANQPFSNRCKLFTRRKDFRMLLLSRSSAA